MQHNEPGREPAEPTDAELLMRFGKEVRLAKLGVGIVADGEALLEALIARGEEYVSGARPMPDTPAPDEVAQLRAEVARLKDELIDRETECNQIHAEMQEPLTAQRLREHNDGYLYLGNGVEVAIAGTTARVAELEALCRVTLGQGKTIVSDASINGIMGGAPTTLLIQVLDESHTIGDDATGFGRDNLEPGDGNVQIVFTKAESVDVVIDTLFKIKGEIESTPAAPEGEGGGK